MTILDILKQYELDAKTTNVVPFGNGLINNTWKIETTDQHYILQKINVTVFKDPKRIEHNMETIAKYIAMHDPKYLFVSPINTYDNKKVVVDEMGYFRVFPFVKGSVTKTILTSPQQAYEAAFQFGNLTKITMGLDIVKLKYPLEHFHDLDLKYSLFKSAIKAAPAEKLDAAKEYAEYLLKQEFIVKEFLNIVENPQFILRVTHHDTKITNVLFDENDKAICVIDFDTLMPGYYVSDVGDMMRTYLSPVDEEEKDYSKIQVRNEFYYAIYNGYMAAMGNELTDNEKKKFYYSGLFMTYMQAIRFLADHLNGDVYYGAKYPNHNLVRAGNQVHLLKKLFEKQLELEDYNQ